MNLPYRYLRAGPLLALVLASACGDDSNEPLVATTLVVDAPVIELDGIAATGQIAVTVLDQNGDELTETEPTFESRNQDVAQVAATGVVTAVGDGSTTIDVAAGSAEADVAIVVQSELTAGVAVSGLAGVEDGQIFFSIDVPPGGGAGQVLQFRTMSGTGDVDMGIRHGTQPTLQVVDCFGALDGNFEVCGLANPEPGTWHVMLLGFMDYSGVTLEASMEPLTPIQDGMPQTALAAPQRDFLYFEFDVPDPGGAAGATDAGTRSSAIVFGDRRRAGFSFLDPNNGPSGFTSPPHRQTGASVLTATTSGGTGDIALFGTALGQIYLTGSAAPECFSSGSTTSTECVVDDPAAGSWTFALFADQAFSQVTFQVVLTP